MTSLISGKPLLSIPDVASSAVTPYTATATATAKPKTTFINTKHIIDETIKQFFKVPMRKNQTGAITYKQDVQSVPRISNNDPVVPRSAKFSVADVPFNIPNDAKKILKGVKYGVYIFPTRKPRGAGRFRVYDAYHVHLGNISTKLAQAISHQKSEQELMNEGLQQIAQQKKLLGQGAKRKKTIIPNKTTKQAQHRRKELHSICLNFGWRKIFRDSSMKSMKGFLKNIVASKSNAHNDLLLVDKD